MKSYSRVFVKVFISILFVFPVNYSYAEELGPTQEQLETLPENIKTFEIMKAKLRSNKNGKKEILEMEIKNLEAQNDVCKRNLTQLQAVGVSNEVIQKSLWLNCTKEFDNKIKIAKERIKEVKWKTK